MPGRLSVEKCVLLGVPANKCRSRLKNGESVTLESGKVIEPEDVLEDSVPIVRVIIIDFPHISPLTKDYFIQNLDSMYEKDAVDKKPISYFVHMTPSDIQASSEYKELFTSREYFMDGMHLKLDEKEPNIDSSGIFEMQTRLNSVSDWLFPQFHIQDLWISDRGENAEDECNVFCAVE
ncbi:hypothetical protein ACOME3_002364 [Neoechinorhynchus agilis]